MTCNTSYHFSKLKNRHTLHRYTVYYQQLPQERYTTNYSKAAYQTSRTLSYSGICGLAGIWLIYSRLHWLWFQFQIGSRSVPHVSQPPWTSKGDLEHVLLTAEAGMSEEKVETCDTS